MSNNITKFLNSRNEVNLSSEKIELTVASDLIELLKKSRGFKDEVLSKVNGGNRSIGEFEKKWQDLTSKAKDLGVTIPKELTALDKEATGLKSFFTNIK